MSCVVPITADELAALKKDYRDLISGNKARVVVDQNGERVEFSSANASRLYLMIQEQEALLCPSTPARPNRPMGFIF